MKRARSSKAEQRNFKSKDVGSNPTGLSEFEAVVVLRVRQLGADASDAANRIEASLKSALCGKLLFPSRESRSGFWTDACATRVQAQGHTGQVTTVLMTKEIREMR